MNEPAASVTPHLEAAVAAFFEAAERGEAPDRDELLRRYPEVAAELNQFFEDHDRVADLARPQRTAKMALEQTMPLGAPGTRDPTWPAADSTASQTGWQIGQYEIVEEIGRGGMGVVFKARHVGLDRVVALKTILAGRLASADDRSRFAAEALAAARLSHPGIVPIFEVGEAAGQPFFAMPLVEGESLAERLKAGPLAPQVAARLLLKVAAAVTYAHAHGIIHRDLKPGNILLARGEGSSVSGLCPPGLEDCEPKITDFGLAKRIDSSDPLTATGQILGTPSYMAPEQAGGRRAIGPAADVYALGAILYAMLTGVPPFQAENPVELILNVIEREPPLPSKLRRGLPRELEAICMKCLEKNPLDRYASAADLAADLDRYLRREPLQARRPSPAQWLRRWMRRQPVLAWHLIALTSLLTLTQVIYAIKQHDDMLYHLRISGALGVWMLACLAFQWLMQSQRRSDWPHYAWSATDALMLTGVLALCEGPLGPLVGSYLMLICTAGLFFRTRLVVFTTASVMLSYLLLLVLRPEECRPWHYALLFQAALAITGLLIGYQVWRMSVLREYYGERM